MASMGPKKCSKKQSHEIWAHLKSYNDGGVGKICPPLPQIELRASAGPAVNFARKCNTKCLLP